MIPRMTERSRPVPAELPVDQVMSVAPDRVDAAESTLMAWEMMRRGGYHHLPVVELDGTYLGMLDTETMAASWPAGGPDRARTPVSDLLGPGPHPRVRLGDPVRAAAVAMVHRRTRAVAVTDDDGRLAGIITSYDLLRLLAAPVPAR